MSEPVSSLPYLREQCSEVSIIVRRTLPYAEDVNHSVGFRDGIDDSPSVHPQSPQLVLSSRRVKLFAPRRAGFCSQRRDSTLHSLSHVSGHVSDFTQRGGRDEDCIGVHLSCFSTASHVTQPACLRSPPAAFSSANASCARRTSSTVSSHSTSASQSSALSTANRFPCTVTN